MIDSIPHSLSEVSFPLKHQLINQMISFKGTLLLSYLYPCAVSGNVMHSLEKFGRKPRNQNNPQMLKLWGVHFAFSHSNEHVWPFLQGLGGVACQVLQKTWLWLLWVANMSEWRAQASRCPTHHHMLEIEHRAPSSYHVTRAGLAALVLHTTLQMHQEEINHLKENCFSTTLLREEKHLKRSSSSVWVSTVTNSDRLFSRDLMVFFSICQILG